MQIELLTLITLAGPGLKFVKIFRDCIQKIFMTLRVTNFFFRDVDLLSSLRNFCEWSDRDFSNSVCKHSCVLLFSAGISLTLFLRRRQRWGKATAVSTRWHCVERINHSRNSWLVPWISNPEFSSHEHQPAVDVTPLLKNKKTIRYFNLGWWQKLHWKCSFYSVVCASIKSLYTLIDAVTD